MKRSLGFPVIFLFVVSFMLTYKTNGQSLNADDIKTQLVTDWQRAKDYTIEYLNAMPADKYGAKAVDSLRSFAQQMLHLATANIFFISNAIDVKPLSWMNFELEKRPSAQNKDSVMYYVIASYDFCINTVKNSDAKKWGEKKKIFGFEATRFAFIQKAFEHQTHHRGQTTIYIRLQNIIPPQEKIF